MTHAQDSLAPTFAELGLNQHLLLALSEQKYLSPTPIQAKAIPAALSGRDLLASAQTGTGKTAAFILPILQKLATPAAQVTGKRSRGPRALVLTPTRELASQITKATHLYGKHPRPVNVVSIVGGESYQRQRQGMSRDVDIMVATPGRLADYMRQGEIDFRRIEFLVLDEADRMLDMGFRDEVFAIAAALPTPRQNLLFSATLDSSVCALATKILVTPVRIEIAPQKTRHAQIIEHLHFVSDMQEKIRLLEHIITQDGVEKALVFTATKRSADDISDILNDKEFAAAPLHGDMRQNARNRTVSQLRTGKIQVMVATDVAARGLDIQGISHVINFDLPRMSEDYTHRIGRTGRASASGVAISFAYPYERKLIRYIEQGLGRSIPVLAIPGFTTTSSSPSQRERKRDSRDSRGPSRTRRHSPRPERSHAQPHGERSEARSENHRRSQDRSTQDRSQDRPQHRSQAGARQERRSEGRRSHPFQKEGHSRGTQRRNDSPHRNERERAPHAERSSQPRGDSQPRDSLPRHSQPRDSQPRSSQSRPPHRGERFGERPAKRSKRRSRPPFRRE